MKNRIAIITALTVVIVLAVRSPLLQADIPTLLIAIVLGIVCLLPSILWIRYGMQWLPLFELYALVHLGYYWMPSISATSVMWKVPESLRFPVIAATCLYLIAG